MSSGLVSRERMRDMLCRRCSGRSTSATPIGYVLTSVLRMDLAPQLGEPSLRRSPWSEAVRRIVMETTLGSEGHTACLIRCLTVIEEQLGITERRLLKSGATHFAKARFDAIAFVVRTYIAPNDRSDPLPAALQNRVAALGDLMMSFVTTYPELDPVRFPRLARTRLRTEEIADEIIRLADLPRHRPHGRVDLYAAPQLIMSGESREESSPLLRLDGKFF